MKNGFDALALAAVSMDDKVNQSEVMTEEILMRNSQYF